MRHPLARLDVAVIGLCFLVGVQLAGLAYVWELAEQARRDERRRIAKVLDRLDEVEVQLERTFVAPPEGPAEVRPGLRAADEPEPA